MSKARDEVHNSEVEECNLISWPASQPHRWALSCCGPYAARGGGWRTDLAADGFALLTLLIDPENLYLAAPAEATTEQHGQHCIVNSGLSKPESAAS
jgi:hypothetical protein